MDVLTSSRTHATSTLALDRSHHFIFSLPLCHDTSLFYNMCPYASKVPCDFWLIARDLSFFIHCHLHILRHCSSIFAELTESIPFGAIGVWISQSLLSSQLTPNIKFTVTEQTFATAIRCMYGAPNPKLDKSIFDYDGCNGDMLSFAYVCRRLHIPRSVSYTFEEDIETCLRITYDMHNLQSDPIELLYLAERLSFPKDKNWINAALRVIMDLPYTLDLRTLTSNLITLSPQTLAHALACLLNLASL